MKEIISTIQEWWKRMRAEHHRKQVMKREKELHREALRRIQVREFEGLLYFCYNDIPLIEVENFCMSAEYLLQNVRAKYVEYHLTKDSWER